ncbi:MAG: PIG-L family deacetylase [Blastocatellia bacterium]|nr:PIG-L family deacetylase [Blastocatellia bacterium]
MYNYHRLLISFLVLVCLSASLRFDTLAQVRPVNDYGAIGLTQMLRRMNTTASVMMIGAHPDDEDSSLMAYLARGENARTAYLSLTRGDGGQNVIGPELFEPLGIIRTEELLQARRLDGAEQYFARAFDFGFSKTLDETRSKWPEEVIKCDVVRAIRTFKPLVVISRFSGTPADNHGHHQYAGYISPIAVKAAADWNQCKGAGDPWQVRKFYRSQGFSSTDQAALQMNTGRFDHLYGRSYFEIAIEGRSQHKSQGEGRLELKGDQFSGLRLQNVAVAPAEKSPFDGIDTSINGIAELARSSEAPFNSKLKPIADAVAAVTAKYRPDSAQDIAVDLAKIYKMASDAEWSTRRPESKRFMRELQAKTAAAIRLASGIQIDLLSDKETVTPGGEVVATLRVYSPLADISFTRQSISAPRDYLVSEQVPQAAEPQAGPFRRERGKLNEIHRIKVPASAEITQPYWLKDPRNGELFEWPNSDEQTLSFSPPTVVANVTASVGGIEIPLSQPLEFRYADLTRGEIRRNVAVVPQLSVALDRDLIVVPSSNSSQMRTVAVSLVNNAAIERAGNVGFNIASQKDWKVTPRDSSTFSLKPGAKTTLIFDISIPANTPVGSVPMRVSASVGNEGGSASLTMRTVAYPHIQTHRYYTQSDASIRVLDLDAPTRNVGYVMGSGDEVPEAIRQIGMPVTMLEEKDLASGDLAMFDTIVVGVRATETRPDMMANKARLLDYVKNGGNLIVQYQRGGFANSGLPPFPVTTADTQRTAAGAIARVTDENAKVTILKPEHPFFASPNKITDADFEGWVQERNAYNLVTFDPQYTALLESHDGTEQPNNGGLVTAKVGAGTWTYCSYSFFRQLPAGVPGAYRLFANMLSLPRNSSK